MDHPELTNLAAKLKEDELAEIGETVLRDFQSDDTARKDWLDMHARWLNLYYQQDKPLNRPWEGASEESMPLLAEACNQFHARAYPALFPNNKVVKAVPTGHVDPVAEKRAERIGKHISYQLMERAETYKDDKDALLHAVPLHGSHFTKTYADPMRKNWLVVKNVRALDLVVPYGTGPRELSDIDRKTEIVWLSYNEGLIREKSGFFITPPEVWTGGDKNEVDQAAEDAHGVSEPGDKDTKGYCKILEQHRLWDLDEDGIQEPVIVWYDCESQKVLRLAIRYDVDEMGNPTDEKRPVEYYTHWMFLPNPDGFYGLGYGHLIGKINTAVNKMLRQSIDAGTLANTKSGFISDALSIRGGEHKMTMGVFKKVPVTERLADHVHEFKFSEPSQAIIELMTALMARSDRLATVTEALTGQTEKVMQPTTILALIEQGLQVFSTVYERLWRAWTRELRKVYRLNSIYLEEQEYFNVLDLNGIEQVGIARADYADDMQVLPMADPKMATEQQKLARAEAQWQFLINNPLVQTNPRALWVASRDMAEVLNIENFEEILPPPTPESMKPPPDPQFEATLAKLSADAEKFRLQSEMDRQKMAGEAERHRVEMSLEVEKMNSEQDERNRRFNLDMGKIKAEADRARAEADLKLKELEIKAQELQIKGAELDIKRRELEVQQAEVTSKVVVEREKIAAQRESDDKKMQCDMMVAKMQAEQAAMQAEKNREAGRAQ